MGEVVGILVSEPKTPVLSSSTTLLASSAVPRMAPAKAPSAPVRASPRKSSSTYSSQIPQSSQPHTQPPQPLAHLPTPLSLSPSTSLLSNPQKLPPSFSPPNSQLNTRRVPPSLTPSSRYSTYTPSYSPYKPGEYGRSERGLASERTTTRVERRLFDEGDDELKVPSKLVELTAGGALNQSGAGGSGSGGSGNRGSSPLAPAFEAKMVLRNGASVDLISWLRTNFTHTPPHSHTAMTPSLSLIGIRALLLERFPRVPELDELSRAVTAAFPHSRWDYPTGPFRGAEPPTVRGLFWCGKDVAEEDDDMSLVGDDQPGEKHKGKDVMPNIVTRSSARGKLRTSYPAPPTSRSPTQSTLVSPTSTNARRHQPNTPARSVLEEFAEIATLAGKTPVSKTRSLPGDALEEVGEGVEGMMAPAPAYALANICNSFDSRLDGAAFGISRKRRASDSPTTDKLHGLLAAAEAVEGSPITSVLGRGAGERGHKRRRTIGGLASMREHSYAPRHQQQQQQQQLPRKAMSSRGTASPTSRYYNSLPHVEESVDMLVPLNDALSTHEEDYDPETASTSIPKRGHTASSASQSSSIISSLLPLQPPVQPQPQPHRPNELSTNGDQPGVDCKPPHPYHELIRYAIETAPDQRLQLSQIYSSIAERFPFFKSLDEKKTAGWQNSIRHNLSLKKMFVRVNKIDGLPEDTSGKGGWWIVIPGVPDEGRPGRKAKAKRTVRGDESVEVVGGGGGGGWAGPAQGEVASVGGKGESRDLDRVAGGEKGLFTDEELRRADAAVGGGVGGGVGAEDRRGPGWN